MKRSEILITVSDQVMETLEKQDKNAADRVTNGMAEDNQADVLAEQGSKKLKKIKKVKKKKKVKVLSSDSNIDENNLQNLNISVPESEGFSYSRAVSVNEVETEREYIKPVHELNTRALPEVQETEDNAFISAAAVVDTIGPKGMTVGNQIEQLHPLPERSDTVAVVAKDKTLETSLGSEAVVVAKDKTFETSFGPEDEEVAQINRVCPE